MLYGRGSSRKEGWGDVQKKQGRIHFAQKKFRLMAVRPRKWHVLLHVQKGENYWEREEGSTF